jgi:N6-L-threonylcarbamoyladenine synthase
MKNEYLILGIETSCDETASAVVRNNTLLSNVVYSQTIHSKYGGVVPELASRSHQEKIVSVIDKAINDAGVEKRDINGIAVTKGPGLVGSLLVGMSFAQALSISMGIPCIGINHLEAHIWSSALENKSIKPPFISLLISGGHTQLIYVKEFGVYETLGRTRDDAAGEAFDKVAKLLGLGYPGGKNIDMLARKGNMNFFNFPQIGPRGNNYDFSFSGIKTAVLYYLNGVSEEIKHIHLNDICASFQIRVVEVLLEKTFKALKDTGLNKLVLAGGVAANSLLIERMKERAKKENFKLYYPSPIFCTDNAAIVAYVGMKYLKKGVYSNIGIKPEPMLNI